MRPLSVVVLAALATTEALKPTRRSFVLRSGAAGALVAVGAPAGALVKGSTPPPRSARSARVCRDIDECEEAGRQRAAERFGAEELPFETTADGVRYRDVRAAISVSSVSSIGLPQSLKSVER